MHPHERVAQRKRQSLRWRALAETAFPALPMQDQTRLRALAAEIADVLGLGNRFPADQEEPLACLRIRLRALGYVPVVHRVVDTTRTFAAGRGAFGHHARETDFAWGDTPDARVRGTQTQYADVGWVPAETAEGEAARAALDALAVAQSGAGATHQPMPTNDTLALPAGHGDWLTYAQQQLDATRAEMLAR